VTIAIGIDPSIRSTGVAVVEFRAGRVTVVEKATLRATCPEEAIRELVRYLGECPIAEVTGVEELARAVHGHSLRKTTSYAATWVRELSGAAYGAAMALRMNPVFVEPSAWRSALGLPPASTKEHVRRAVCARIGPVAHLSEHEADAIGIAIRAEAVERVRGIRRIEPR